MGMEPDWSKVEIVDSPRTTVGGCILIVAVVVALLNKCSTSGTWSGNTDRFSVLEGLIIIAIFVGCFMIEFKKKKR